MLHFQITFSLPSMSCLLKLLNDVRWLNLKSFGGRHYATLKGFLCLWISNRRFMPVYCLNSKCSFYIHWINSFMSQMLRNSILEWFTRWHLTVVILKSFRCKNEIEDEYGFLCLIIVRMRICLTHVTQAGKLLSTAPRQRNCEEKSFSREQDLRRWILQPINFLQLIKNH